MKQDIFKRIRRIQIQTTQLANDIFAGAYRSAFRGKGMEFEEVREYQPGEDARNMPANLLTSRGQIQSREYLRSELNNYRRGTSRILAIIRAWSRTKRFEASSKSGRGLPQSKTWRNAKAPGHSLILFILSMHLVYADRL